MTAWEKEKAYCARRAEALAQEMENAIARLDVDDFKQAYTTAARYMKKGQRQELYRRFLAVAYSSKGR